jgi:hypothetical protein
LANRVSADACHRQVAIEGLGVQQDRTFELSEMLSLDFEARCVGEDRARYLWHHGCGLRIDPTTQAVTLITDPARLPRGPWTATKLGESELEKE